MLKISFLGGVGEFGKNMTIYEQDDSLLMVDCGSAFPESDAPGIDLIIPDFSYLAGSGKKLAGLVLTHGHEDHIGASPFLLKDFPMPVYGSRLTLGFLKRKLDELAVEPPRLNLMEPGEALHTGPFSVEGIPVTHSIPDSLSILLKTRDAAVFHSGDFKFDQTPLDGKFTDYGRLIRAGEEGVTAMVMDSTNVEVPQTAGSETLVKATLERYVSNSRGSLFVTLFSSNLARIQAVFDLAAIHDKKVVIFGRSLVQNVAVGENLGFLKIPVGVRVAVDRISDYRREDVVIIISGSQGEPFSALSRVAFGEHKSLHFEEDDLLIVSARIIPGNEKRVARVVNQIYRSGGRVVTSRDDTVHVSGHAGREELKLMTSWIRPRYYVPVHGEYRQLFRNAALAEEMGLSKDNVLLSENGGSLIFEGGSFIGRGEVPSGNVLMDQVTADSVDHVIVRDRRNISKDGMVVPILVVDSSARRMEAEPEIITRGYPFLEGNAACLEEIRDALKAMWQALSASEITDMDVLRAKVKSTVKRTLKRNDAKIPLIIPVVMET